MLFIRNSFSRAILLLMLAASLFSCKKTDEYAKEVNNAPYLITGEIGLQEIGKGYYPGFQRSFLLGDTMTLVGRFFVDKPGTEIRLGNQAIQPLEKYQLPHGINSYTKQTEYLDVLRFIITKGMGLGNHIPLSIVANGQTVQAPDIAIRQFLGGMHKTDTTLYVDQLANWKPKNMVFYQRNYLPLIRNSSVTANGDIYFSNNTEANVCKDGRITNLLNVNDQFQENGATFTIKMIEGSVVAYDGSKLSFSAEVTEDSPDTTASYIFRLCNMDLVTKKITTLNRTLVTKGLVITNENAGPFEGPLGSLKVVARTLKTDVNGSLYFVNNYAPARVDWVNQTNWYKKGIGPSSIFIRPAVYANICKVDAGGTVKSIFKQNEFWAGPSPYNIPGLPLEMTSDYLISPDGKMAFGCNLISNYNYSYATFDLEQEELQSATGAFMESYHLFSYDTSSVTGLHEPVVSVFFNFANQYYFTNLLFTPDGDLLLINNSSIASVSMPNKTLYCYAGTEKGLSDDGTGQNKVIGPAKNVLFTSYNTLMIGMDKQGSILYSGSQNDYVNGVNFYRLYSRK